MHSEPSILCVDDDPANLIALSYALGDRFPILTANSGREAIDVLAKRNVGVLLSDQRMPEMQGFELCRIAKERFPDVSRFIITAYSDPGAIREAINCGHVIRHFIKPWNEEDLVKALRTGIDAYHMATLGRALQARLPRASRDAASTFVLGRTLHEIANPAVAAIAMLEVLELKAAEIESGFPDAPSELSEKLRDMGACVREAMAAMNTLASRLDVFTQLATESPLTDGPSSIAYAVRIVANTLAGEIRECSLLDLDIGPDATVAADEVALAQIVFNLLEHMIESIPPGAPGENRITIRTGRDGDQGFVEMSGTGIGVTAETERNLLWPLDSSRQPMARELGLVIVGETVRALGGRVSLHPVLPSRGLKIRLELPLAPACT